mmetsp:Transcript_5549/g.23021  ORF Transcript_5549/g.23021 Transcript_5549/m.23021 type:complete len:266 (-) Transcript_5549:78-875(-)
MAEVHRRRVRDRPPGPPVERLETPRSCCSTFSPDGYCALSGAEFRAPSWLWTSSEISPRSIAWIASLPTISYRSGQNYLVLFSRSCSLSIVAFTCIWLSHQTVERKSVGGARERVCGAERRFHERETELTKCRCRQMCRVPSFANELARRHRRVVRGHVHVEPGGSNSVGERERPRSLAARLAPDTAVLYMITSSWSPRDRISSRISKARSHWSPFSHAKTAVLYVVASGSNPHDRISSSNASAACHWPPFSHAAIAALYMIEVG